MKNLEDRTKLVLLKIQESKNSIIKYAHDLRNAYDVRAKKRFKFYATKYTKQISLNPLKQKTHYDLLVKAFYKGEYVR